MQYIVKSNTYLYIHIFFTQHSRHYIVQFIVSSTKVLYFQALPISPRYSVHNEISNTVHSIHTEGISVVLQYSMLFQTAIVHTVFQTFKIRCSTQYILNSKQLVLQYESVPHVFYAHGAYCAVYSKQYASIVY